MAFFGLSMPRQLIKVARDTLMDEWVRIIYCYMNGVQASKGRNAYDVGYTIGHTIAVGNIA